MSKQAVIIYGPPGSGKGTQAELLARKYNFIHFDTGRYGESLVYAPGALKDPVLRRERKNFDAGRLFTPSWILGIVKDAVQRIARTGFGVIFSGSPRTLFEALGDKSHQGLLATLKRLYSRKNITILKLSIREGTTLKRNSRRFVCSICGLPVLARAKTKQCAFCAGPLRKRSLDNPKIIKVRIKEYRDRTYPILARAKKLGLKLIQINGEPSPYKVHQEILRKLGLK